MACRKNMRALDCCRTVPSAAAGTKARGWMVKLARVLGPAMGHFRLLGEHRGAGQVCRLWRGIKRDDNGTHGHLGRSRHNDAALNTIPEAPVEKEKLCGRLTFGGYLVSTVTQKLTLTVALLLILTLTLTHLKLYDLDSDLFFLFALTLTHTRTHRLTNSPPHSLSLSLFTHFVSLLPGYNHQRSKVHAHVFISLLMKKILKRSNALKYIEH
jgi:hypothetical protein